MRITGTKRARLRTGVVALTLVGSLALAGCSDDGDDDDRPEAGPVAEVLDEAVASFSHGNTGSYTFQLGDDGEPLIRSTGEFALDVPTSTTDLTLVNGERTSRAEQVRIGDRAWFRVAKDGAEPTGCWEQTTPQRAATRLGIAQPPKDDQAVVPPVAAVVTGAVGTEWIDEGTTARATTDLYAVAATLGDAVTALDLTPGNTRGEVEVTILLDREKGTVLAWRTDLVTVLKALQESGADLDQETVALLDSGVDLPVMAGFSDLGDGIDVEAPAPVC